MLLAQILGLSEILGTEEFWPLLLGLTICWPALQLLCLPFIPESPRYLLLSKDKEEDARAGTYDVHTKVLFENIISFYVLLSWLYKLITRSRS